LLSYNYSKKDRIKNNCWFFRTENKDKCKGKKKKKILMKTILTNVTLDDLLLVKEHDIINIADSASI
jgi:hypothetical protein